MRTIIEKNSKIMEEKVNFSLNGDNYYLPRSKAVELFGEYAVRVLLKGAPQPPEEDKTN